jgi:gas vesicle protein
MYYIDGAKFIILSTMDDNKKAGSFMKGTMLGVLIGAVAGVLFAPKSGKETREDIKKTAKDVAKKAGDMYEDARSLVEAKIEALQRAGKRIDKDKYGSLVQEVISELKNDREVTADAAKRVGAQLRKDWDRISKALGAK